MPTKKAVPKSRKPHRRLCIVTTQWRDLYYGCVSATDSEIARSHSVRVEECRHIAYWKGPTGGLTSLAVGGPGAGSRIGAPTTEPALITGVAHVFPVSAEAAERFAAIRP